MNVSYNKICINPTKPCKQAGFIQQINEINEIHDDLYARIIAFDFNDMTYYHISIDSLGLDYSITAKIKAYLQSHSNKKINLTISATHTHFAPDSNNKHYQNELISKIIMGILKLEYIENVKASISYQKISFDKLGQSRISNHIANTILGLIQIYINDEPKIVLINYNCHPTILHNSTSYFSSEYPGYILDKLSKLYPSIFFSFIQGASGDISSRFTRQSQDYDGLRLLSESLLNQIVALLKLSPISYPFTNINYNEETLLLNHEIKDIDISNLPCNLKEREIETIKIGAIVQKELKEKIDSLQKEIIISKLSIGPYKLIFTPNELFSNYLNYIDTNNTILVCYSNGYSSYVTDLNENIITYESFTDTYSKATKTSYIDILKNNSY